MCAHRPVVALLHLFCHASIVLLRWVLLPVLPVLRSAASMSIGIVPATTSAASSDTLQKLLVMRSAQRL